jgi:hypothetical protein
MTGEKTMWQKKINFIEYPIKLERPMNELRHF